MNASASPAASGASSPRRSLERRTLQCRKWRTPVKTIATPRSFAAAITSSSRIDPPGWITHAAPASMTTSRPSRNGKNASLATAEPASERLRRLGLDRGDPRRVEPAHLAGADAERHAVGAEDDRVALDVARDLPGEQQVARLRRRRRLGVVTTLRSLRRRRGCRRSGSGAPSRRASGRARCGRRPAAGRSICSTRVFALAAKTASASALYDGAISTSTNCLATRSAQARSTSPLKAMMPPKAEVGSVLNAFA